RNTTPGRSGGPTGSTAAARASSRASLGVKSKGADAAPADRTLSGPNPTAHLTGVGKDSCTMPAHRFLVAPVRLLLALALLLATMFTVGSHPATAVPGEDDSTAAAPGEPEREPDLLDGLDGLAAGVEESDDPDQPAPKAAKPVKVKKSGEIGRAHV